jgi:hypothetical protein
MRAMFPTPPLAKGFLRVGEVEECFCCRETGKLIWVNYPNPFFANLISREIPAPSRQKGESNEAPAANSMP